jgi:MscS family membrane protein
MRSTDLPLDAIAGRMFRREVDTSRRVRRLPPSRGSAWLAVAFALAFDCAPLAARAGQLGPPPSPPSAAPSSSTSEDEEPPEIPVAPDSPRASIRRYMELCRGGDYTEAARYLDLPPKADGVKLAQQLKAVLDRHLWYLWSDPEALSPQPLGDAQDGLAPGVDQLGKIPGPSGQEPVRIVRRATESGVRWVFTRATVDRIDTWYARLEDRWLRDHLPPALLRPGPRELLWWQWLALPVLALAGWLFGKVLSYIARAVLRRVVIRTASTLDDEVFARTRSPFTFGFAVLAIAAALPWLRLYETAETFLEKVLRAGVFLAFFWLVLRVVDAGRAHLLKSPMTRENPAARSLAPLVGRIVKVAILVMGVIAVLSELGYPVASLLAGLGIGGVAVALAAQKTVENLFGSISIGVDQPFRVGDFVKIDSTQGTVEAIGLRSTRIRTPDRTVITIPNGKLADLHIESFATRDRLRLACTLALVYETTSDQLRTIVNGCERTLREHPRIWPDEVVVRFVAFGQSSLDIEVAAWFVTADFGEFRGIRQEMLLAFMQIVEAAGSRFAFPAQTVYLAPNDEKRVPSAPPPRGAPDAPAAS